MYILLYAYIHVYIRVAMYVIYDVHTTTTSIDGRRIANIMVMIDAVRARARCVWVHDIHAM